MVAPGLGSSVQGFGHSHYREDFREIVAPGHGVAVER